MEKINRRSSWWYGDDVDVDVDVDHDHDHSRSSSLMDQFERLSIEVQLNRAMLHLGRSSSESILTTRSSSNSIMHVHQLQPAHSSQLPSSTKVLDQAAAAGSTSRQRRSGPTKVIMQKLLRLPLLILGWKKSKGTGIESGPAPAPVRRRRRSSRETEGGDDQTKAKEEEEAVLSSSLYLKALSRSLRV